MTRLAGAGRPGSPRLGHASLAPTAPCGAPRASPTVSSGRAGARRRAEGRSTYASSDLTDAAGRFSARLGHLTRVLSDEADAAGVALRSSATHYRESDILAPAQMNRLNQQLDVGVMVL